jgi:hypothetical protein
MSDPHLDEVIPAGPHGVEDHADEPGHEHDDHAHPGEALGPIDWPAYGAGALGVLVGFGIAAAFATAVGVIT